MAMTKVDSGDPLALRGHLKLTVVDPDGNVVDEREGDNIICATGYTALAAAAVWSGIEDQALNLGITTPTYLTPLYGAVGTGSGSVSVTDTQLFAEVSRTTVGAGASTPATSTVSALATWMFFFTNALTPYTVTEAGVFANATSVVNTGSMVDHWAFSPTITVPTTNALILQVSLEYGP
jgi:hypothetical protein